MHCKYLTYFFWLLARYLASNVKRNKPEHWLKSVRQILFSTAIVVGKEFRELNLILFPEEVIEHFRGKMKESGGGVRQRGSNRVRAVKNYKIWEWGLVNEIRPSEFLPWHLSGGETNFLYRQDRR